MVMVIDDCNGRVYELLNSQPADICDTRIMTQLRILLTLVTLLVVTTSIVSAHLGPGPCPCFPVLGAPVTAGQQSGIACCSETRWTGLVEVTSFSKPKIHSFEILCRAEPECVCEIPDCTHLPGDMLSNQPAPGPQRSQGFIALLPKAYSPLDIPGKLFRSRVPDCLATTPFGPIFLNNSVFRL